jgi:hypothetical protein
MRLRLVKVIVQPVFMLDDGTTLTEVEHPATVIPANEWPTYSGERFPNEVAEWQHKLDDETTSAAADARSGATPLTPSPAHEQSQANGAAERAAPAP